jgi:hypothetical protein
MCQVAEAFSLDAEMWAVRQRGSGPRPDKSGRVQVLVSLAVRAPAATVYEAYADYRRWPTVFPAISGVRLVQHDGHHLVLEVDHIEGKVINVLTLQPGRELRLWESKRRYDASFVNRFESAPGGARVTVTGDIRLKGPVRFLAPFLRPYVRRQILRLTLQPLKTAAEATSRRQQRGVSGSLSRRKRGQAGAG